MSRTICEHASQHLPQLVFCLVRWSHHSGLCRSSTEHGHCSHQPEHKTLNKQLYRAGSAADFVNLWEGEGMLDMKY